MGPLSVALTPQASVHAWPANGCRWAIAGLTPPPRRATATSARTDWSGSARRRTGRTAFVQIEVGHAAQNIPLQAAALGLAAVPVGSLDPSHAADTLALPHEQTVLYLIPVGHVP